jgi:hypothetical protein
LAWFGLDCPGNRDRTVTVANGQGLALLFVPIEQIVRSFVTPFVLAQRGARAAIESHMRNVRGKLELFIAEVTKYEGLYDEFEQKLDEINKALSPDIAMTMINRLNHLDLKTMSERASSLDLDAPEESLVDQLLADARNIVRHMETLIIQMKTLLKRPMG